MKLLTIEIKPNPVHWQQAIDLLRTGDIGLCRASGIEGRAIVRVTGYQYSHACMYGLDISGKTSRWLQGETVGHYDTRLIDLESEVWRYPGLYDVYRIRSKCWRNSATGPGLAWDFIRAASGSGYSWQYIWRVWLRRRISSLFPPIPNSDDPKEPRDCSGLVHAGIRQGHGPAYQPFDCDVVPGHLANPNYADYIATLFHAEGQVKEFLSQQERVS